MVLPSFEGVGAVAPTYRTFEEWSSAGFRIYKGALSHKRDAEGTPLFHETQVYSPDDLDPDYFDEATYGDTF